MAKQIVYSYQKDDFSIVNKTFFSSDIDLVPRKMPFYLLYFIIKGEARVMLNNTFITLYEGDFVILNKQSVFSRSFHKNQVNELISISIHPKYLESMSNDDYFYKIFKSENFTKNIFNINNHESIKTTVAQIKKALQLHLGKAHLLPRVYSIISDLCIYYDELFSHENISTDSIPVKIIDYIDLHFLKDITYEELSKKFGVSVPTLNKIIKTSTGMTLHNYILSLRLDYAKDLMDQSINSEKIAEMSGFNTYSTFYRAYKKFYGVPPKTDNTKTKKKWPLTN